MMGRTKTTALNTTGKSLVELKDSNTVMCRQKMHAVLPRKCVCCGFLKLNKAERLFAKARDEFDEEANIISILKKLRKFQSWYETMERKCLLPMIEDENLINGYRIVTTDTSSFGSDFSGDFEESDLKCFDDDDEEELKEEDSNQTSE